MTARLLVLLLAASQLALAADKKVLCFGDSWAAFACDTLHDVFKAHLHENTVDNAAISGSTASIWAANPDAIVAILVKYKPDLIWLSIGGDDILGYYKALGGNSTLLNAQILANMTTMLNTFQEFSPLTEIVIFGYDLLNFVETTECEAMMATIFGLNATQTLTNEVLLSYGNNVLRSAALRFPRLTYVPVWGLLQSTEPSVIPGPYPNVNYPSPYDLMNDGCIHASKKGWAILMEALYKNFFASHL